MYNVYQAWSFLGRAQHRCICFKGGGSADIPETEAQRASSEIALKNYNDYMQTIRPVENEFIADVTADPGHRETQVAGQINADVAQKVGTPTIDPNRGMAPGGTASVGNVLADSQVKGKQNVDNQRLSGMQAVVDMGMGKATTAQLGMSNLASQSVENAANAVENQNYMDNTKMSAGATGVMTGVGMAEEAYKYHKSTSTTSPEDW